MSIRIHHFFYPTRLAWPQATKATGSFEDFITSGEDGNDSQVVPTMATTGVAGDLFDHYGIPPVAGVNVSAIPIIGFNNIFNEYYRDQDLVPKRQPEEKTIPNIAWEKDYFTSARPWPQKGPDITIPVAGQAPVKGIGKHDGTFSGSQSVRESDGSQPTYASSISIDNASASSRFSVEEDPSNAGFPNIYADLTQAEAVKVNELRKAFALQRYAEARARYGSRFTEYLRYLQIVPSDARLDRPEYLGGGRVQLATSEVLQTAPEGTTPARDYGVGDMYGHGIGAMRTNRYRKFFEEHGYVHTLMSIRPKAMYQQSIDRHWLRTTRDTVWQRELQHIGQQEVMKNEIYADPVAGMETWAYQDRYSEYRKGYSKVSGEFRTILNYWHLSRDFATDPVLNQAFVECVPSKRIFNEQTQNSCWVMANHKLVARRLVAKRASSHIF